MGALTVGVVTKPFQFEGTMKGKIAEAGLSEMKKNCHSVIVIPNQRLLNLAPRGTSLQDAFLIADDILRQAVAGITDLIVTPGRINVDFSDVRAIMSFPGRAVMGMGVATGENRAQQAAQSAISSQLLEDGSIEGARGVLMNISGGVDLGLHEVDEAASVITDKVDSDAKVIWGTTFGNSESKEIRVTVIATGFQQDEAMDNTPDGPVKRGVAGEERRNILKKVPRTFPKEAVLASSKEGGVPCEAELEVPTFLRWQMD
jgi:cell division protein FtsZ